MGGDRRRAALALTLLAALVGCGSDDDSPANVRSTPKATVVLIDGAYLPARTRVAAGSRVTFVNRAEALNTAETPGIADNFEYDRDLLDRQDKFDLHILQQGEAESVELDTPGTYRFHSSTNSRMRGVIEVVPTED